MKFRPCIDLHQGVVKQIIGSTLDDENPSEVQTNFVATRPSSWYAELYRRDNLTGGHIIKLGPGCDEAALAALAAWPEGMQIGGGVNAENARFWIENGASHVIVTSYVFHNGVMDLARLEALTQAVGKNKIVLDLSCRKQGDAYFVVTDRWQKFTSHEISPELLTSLADYCDEFLIHAADVEGKCAGIELPLVERLARWTTLPTTYAGGVRNFDDLKLLFEVGLDRLDVTIGSALDIFGGPMKYDEVVNFCRQARQEG